MHWSRARYWIADDRQRVASKKEAEVMLLCPDVIEMRCDPAVEDDIRCF
jgi:hypothetical protein